MDWLNPIPDAPPILDWLFVLGLLAFGFSAGFVIRSLLWRSHREEQDATAYDELRRARRN